MHRQFLTDRDLAARFQTSRPTIWRWTTAGLLPQPVQLSQGCTRWLADEIAAHEATLLATRRRVKARA